MENASNEIMSEAPQTVFVWGDGSVSLLVWRCVPSAAAGSQAVPSAQTDSAALYLCESSAPKPPWQCATQFSPTASQIPVMSLFEASSRMYPNMVLPMSSLKTTNVSGSRVLAHEVAFPNITSEIHQTEWLNPNVTPYSKPHVLNHQTPIRKLIHAIHISGGGLGLRA